MSFVSAISQHRYACVAIITLLSISNIFLVLAYNPDIYMSSDSHSYLMLADNLLSGEGYFVSDPLLHNRYPPEMYEKIITTDSLKRRFDGLFAVWPVGYSTAIYGISSLTNLDPLIASKLVNVVALLIIAATFLFFFPNHAHLYALIFSLATFTQIFAFTLSEPLFLASFLLFVLSSARIPQSEKVWAWVAIAFLSGVAMDLMRYIGMINWVLTLLFAGAAFLLGSKRSLFPFLILAGLLFIFSQAYLGINEYYTGYPTGEFRAPREETLLIWLAQAAKAYIYELNLLHYKGGNTVTFWVLMVVQFAWLGWLLHKHVHRLRIPLNKNMVPAYFCFIAGFGYLGALTILRFQYGFESLNFRLLSPGTLLLLVGALTYLQAHFKALDRPNTQIQLFLFGAIAVLAHLSRTLME